MDKSGFQGMYLRSRGIFVHDNSFLLESFRVDGETIIPLEAGVCYKFNILEVKKQDTLDSNYVPQPFIRGAQPPNFTLPPSHHIWYVDWDQWPWILLTRVTKLRPPYWKRSMPSCRSRPSRSSECLFRHCLRPGERCEIEAQENFPLTQTRLQYSLCFGRGEADSGDLCK